MQNPANSIDPSLSTPMISGNVESDFRKYAVQKSYNFQNQALASNLPESPVATSKSPTCGRVKILHLRRQLEITY